MSQEPQDPDLSNNATFDLPIRLARQTQESQVPSPESHPETTSSDSPAHDQSSIMPQESQEDSSEIAPDNYILHIPTLLLFGGDVAFLEEIEDEQSPPEMNPVPENASTTESAEEGNLPPPPRPNGDGSRRRREAVLLPQGRLGDLIRAALHDADAEDDPDFSELYLCALWGSIDGTGEYELTGASLRQFKRTR